MKIHVIMPMGGAGSRFYKNGYVQPKPLIEIYGKPFLYWATRSITQYLDDFDLTFVALNEHIQNHQIDQVIRKYFPQARIETLEKVLPGPVFTALIGVSAITDEAPVIFNDCDHMFKSVKLNKILNNEELNIDGGVLSFMSNEPQFSYLRLDENGKVVGTVEKQVVSEHAISGAYLFRSADLFRSLFEEYKVDCTYDELYMSGLYNVMCSRGMDVEYFDADCHVEFGTPEEYKIATESAEIREAFI
jgi:dTDP-glucose pyrophosphorylase